MRLVALTPWQHVEYLCSVKTVLTAMCSNGFGRTQEQTVSQLVQKTTTHQVITLKRFENIHASGKYLKNVAKTSTHQVHLKNVSKTSTHHVSTLKRFENIDASGRP